MKRLAALLIAAVLIAALAACGTPPPSGLDEGEIVQIASDLFLRSQPLNEILWGAGLAPVEDAVITESVTAAQYYPVREDSPYQSVADLQAAMAGVFSPAYCASIASAVLEESIDAEDASFNVTPRYIDRNGALCVDITYEGFDLAAVSEVKSVTVVSDTDAAITVEIETDRDTRTVTLTPSSAGWRLDSPSY